MQDNNRKLSKAQTLLEGLELFMKRTESELDEKEKQMTQKIKEEQESIFLIQQKLDEVTQIVAERNKLISRINTSNLDSRKLIRQQISKILQGLRENSHKSNATNIINSLRIIEQLVRVTNMPVPVVDSPTAKGALKSLSSILASVNDLAVSIQDDLSENFDEFANHCSQELTLAKCRDLLENLLPNNQFDNKKEIETLQKIQQVITPEIEQYSCSSLVFSRPVPKEIFSFTQGEDPYVNEEDLLDQVILSTDPEMKFMYQLTYKYFSNPSKLLTQLCVRFCLTPLDDMSEVRVDKYQHHVLQFLRSWIRNFYETDIRGQIAEEIKEFLNSVVCHAGRIQHAQSTLREIEKAEEGISQKKKSEFWQRIFHPVEPLETSLDLLRIKPRQLAEQLALYEHQLYENLRFPEFVGQPWGTNNPLRMEQCPNIVRYSNHCNQASNWFVNHILDISTTFARAEAIDKLIHLMLLSFQLNNFLGTFEILFALNSVAIYRLFDTWKLVSLPKRRIVWIFSRFVSDRFRIYKNDYETITPPLVPYIGIFLSDLTFIEDGNPTRSKDGKINFHFKCYKVYSTILRALEYQAEAYQTAGDEQILSYIHHEFTREPKRNLDQAYEHSVLLENGNKDCNSFRFSATEEQIIEEIQSYRELNILELFAETTSKRSNSLSRVIQLTTGKARSPKEQMKTRERKRAKSDCQRPSSVMIQNQSTIAPDAAESEVIVHMRLPGYGIKKERISINGERREYFFAVTLVKWLSRRLGDFFKYKVMEIAQRLIDGGYIIGFETEDDISKTWSADPQTKLQFGENDIVPLMHTSTYSQLTDSEVDSDDLLIEESVEDTELMNIDYNALAKKMKHPQSGLKIKNRKWLLKKFPNSFVGEQAVNWLCHHLDVNRATAIEVGREMQERQLFRHVVNDQPFQDKYLFYTFE